MNCNLCGKKIDDTRSIYVYGMKMICLICASPQIIATGTTYGIDKIKRRSI